MELLHPPSPTSRDIHDAFQQFEDPHAAAARLEEIKQQYNISGGTLFMNFSYNTDSSTSARMTCGVSRASEGDMDDVDHYSQRVELGVVPAEPYGGSFTNWHNFKLSSRDERLRAIAHCLANIEGMPQLGPAPRSSITQIYMDDYTKQMAREWMRAQLRPAESATNDQLATAFRCMLTAAGQRMPNATGGKVVLRAFDEERSGNFTRSVITGTAGPMTFRRNVTRSESYHTSHAYLAVVGSQKAVDHMFSENDADPTGIWPLRWGNEHQYQHPPVHRFTTIFDGLDIMGEVDRCKVHAGIVITPNLNPNGQVELEAPGGSCDPQDHH